MPAVLCFFCPSSNYETSIVSENQWGEGVLCQALAPEADKLFGIRY